MFPQRKEIPVFSLEDWEWISLTPGDFVAICRSRPHPPPFATEADPTQNVYL